MILIDYKINGNAIVLSKKELEDNLARLADKMEMHRNNNEFEMWMVTAGEREAVTHWQPLELPTKYLWETEF